MERTKKKRIGPEDTPSTPTQATDARRGKEEKKKNRRKDKRKKQGAGPNPATWTILSPLTTRMDHTVNLF